MTTPSSLLIRSAQPGDAAAVARIYNYYIAETIVTFEEDAVSADEMGAHREDPIGLFKFDSWIDVGYWQRQL